VTRDVLVDLYELIPLAPLHQPYNLAAIERFAERMPDASIAIVGPEQVDMTRVRRFPNVHLLGQKAHADVPRYVKAFDIGLVPYRLADYTANVYPTKLNEYLAMGVPVVATDLPEIRRFNRDHGDIVSVAGTPEAYVTAIRAALGPDRPGCRDRRIAVARTNSWSSRIDAMSALVETAIERRDAAPARWEERLRRAYRVARGRALETILAVLAVYLVLFQTNAIWSLAAPLRASAPPEPADAIVVFADVDIAPTPDWLARLLRDLDRADLGMTSGYRWLMPTDERWSTAFVCVINSSIAAAPKRRTPCAFRRNSPQAGRYSPIRSRTS